MANPGEIDLDAIMAEASRLGEEREEEAPYCEFVPERSELDRILFSLLAGSISDELRRGMLEHLPACEYCRRRACKLKRGEVVVDPRWLAEAAQAGPHVRFAPAGEAPAPQPDSGVEQTREDVKPSTRRLTPMRNLILVVAAAAAVGMVAFLVFLERGGEKDGRESVPREAATDAQLGEVTYVRGKVQIHRKGETVEPEVGTLLRGTDRIVAAEGARLTYVRTDESAGELQSISGPQDLVLGQAVGGSEEGAPRTIATVAGTLWDALVAGKRGTIQPVGGRRGGLDLLLPLYPNGLVLDSRPVFCWDLTEDSLEALTWDLSEASVESLVLLFELNGEDELYKKELSAGTSSLVLPEEIVLEPGEFYMWRISLVAAGREMQGDFQPFWLPEAEKFEKWRTRAGQLVQQAAEAGDDPSLWLMLGWFLESCELYADAARAYAKYLRSSPDSEKVGERLGQLGRSLYRLDQDSELERFRATLLRLDRPVGSGF